MTTDPNQLRTRLRSDLTAAMKARDKDTVAVLRTTLAAFDNAEAIPAPPAGTGAHASSEHVAGASVGLGSAEVDRRVLTLEDLHDVLREQIGERTAAADTYDAHRQADTADRLRREVDLLRTYLPE